MSPLPHPIPYVHCGYSKVLFSPQGTPCGGVTQHKQSGVGQQDEKLQLKGHFEKTAVSLFSEMPSPPSSGTRPLTTSPSTPLSPSLSGGAEKRNGVIHSNAMFGSAELELEQPLLPFPKRKGLQLSRKQRSKKVPKLHTGHGGRREECAGEDTGAVSDNTCVIVGVEEKQRKADDDDDLTQGDPAAPCGVSTAALPDTYASWPSLTEKSPAPDCAEDQSNEITLPLSSSRAELQLGTATLHPCTSKGVVGKSPVESAQSDTSSGSDPSSPSLLSGQTPVKHFQTSFSPPPLPSHLPMVSTPTQPAIPCHGLISTHTSEHFSSGSTPPIPHSATNTARVLVQGKGVSSGSLLPAEAGTHLALSGAEKRKRPRHLVQRRLLQTDAGLSTTTSVSSIAATGGRRIPTAASVAVVSQSPAIPQPSSVRSPHVVPPTPWTKPTCSSLLSTVLGDDVGLGDHAGGWRRKRRKEAETEFLTEAGVDEGKVLARKRSLLEEEDEKTRSAVDAGFNVHLTTTLKDNQTGSLHHFVPVTTDECDNSNDFDQSSIFLHGFKPTSPLPHSPPPPPSLSPPPLPAPSPPLSPQAVTSSMTTTTGQSIQVGPHTVAIISTCTSMSILSMYLQTWYQTGQRCTGVHWNQVTVSSAL